MKPFSSVTEAGPAQLAWTFQPTFTPWTFTWASNFGFQGTARIDPMKFLLEMRSPCCNATITTYKGAGVSGRIQADEWLCFSCERRWAGLDYNEDRLELSNFVRLKNGTLNDALHEGHLAAWATDWLSHILDEPLQAQLTAHEWAASVDELAKKLDEWEPTFDERAEELAARLPRNATYADLDKIDELVWKHQVPAAWDWARAVSRASL